MGKLSLLGAQRVKALEGMLDDQLQEKLVEIDKSPQVDSEKEARKAVGIDETFEKAKALVEEANELYKQVNAVCGDVYSASIHYSSNYKNRTEYKDIRDNINDKAGRIAQKSALKKEYNKKKQLLWLCETMEEAKEIVGIE